MCFPNPCQILSKKIPTSHFLIRHKKSDSVARVGQLVGFLVCLSVGWTLLVQFGWFFFVYYFHRQLRLLNIFRS